MTAEQIRKLLGMGPLPNEGGYFVETYRSAHLLEPNALPAGYPGPRSTCTAIYYLLTPDTFSAMHRLRGDEIFHFYLGDPVQLLQLDEQGNGELFTLGTDLAAGMKMQHVVPGGIWQGSRLIEGGNFALLGTTVAPGFEYEDYETGSRSMLQEKYPKFSALISSLTSGS